MRGHADMKTTGLETTNRRTNGRKDILLHVGGTFTSSQVVQVGLVVCYKQIANSRSLCIKINDSE